MKCSSARTRDLESGIVSVGCGSVAKRKFVKGGAKSAKGDGLAVCRLFAPDQRDLHHCAGRSSEDNASGVDLTFASYRTI